MYALAALPIICHARIQRVGGVGGPDPPPLKIHKFIEFPSHNGPVPLKITKLPILHSMRAIIGPPAKRHFNGVLLAGR